MPRKNTARTKTQLGSRSRQQRVGDDGARAHDGPGSKGPTPAFTFTAEAERLAYHIRTVLLVALTVAGLSFLADYASGQEASSSTWAAEEITVPVGGACELA